MAREQLQEGTPGDFFDLWLDLKIGIWAMLGRSVDELGTWFLECGRALSLVITMALSCVIMAHLYWSRPLATPSCRTRTRPTWAMFLLAFSMFQGGQAGGSADDRLGTWRTPSDIELWRSGQLTRREQAARAASDFIRSQPLESGGLFLTTVYENGPPTTLPQPPGTLDMHEFPEDPFEFVEDLVPTHHISFWICAPFHEPESLDVAMSFPQTMNQIQEMIRDSIHGLDTPWLTELMPPVPQISGAFGSFIMLPRWALQGDKKAGTFVFYISSPITRFAVLNQLALDTTAPLDVYVGGSFAPLQEDEGQNPSNGCLIKVLLQGEVVDWQGRIEDRLQDPALWNPEEEHPAHVGNRFIEFQTTDEVHLHSLQRQWEQGPMNVANGSAKTIVQGDDINSLLRFAAHGAQWLAVEGDLVHPGEYLEGLQLPFYEGFTIVVHGGRRHGDQGYLKITDGDVLEVHLQPDDELTPSSHTYSPRHDSGADDSNGDQSDDGEGPADPVLGPVLHDIDVNEVALPHAVDTGMTLSGTWAPEWVAPDLSEWSLPQVTKDHVSNWPPWPSFLFGLPYGAKPDVAIFTDGSWHEASQTGGYAALLVLSWDGQHSVFGLLGEQTHGNPQSLWPLEGPPALRNEEIALFAALLWLAQSSNFCRFRAVSLHYDCYGAGKVTSGEWSPGSPFADKLRCVHRWVEKIIDAPVDSVHVKAHKGHPLNEAADLFAKQFAQGGKARWTSDPWPVADPLPKEELVPIKTASIGNSDTNATSFQVNFATANVQGIGSKHKYLEEQFDHHGTNLVLLQEVTGHSGCCQSKNYLRLTTESLRHRGVSVWISKRHGLIVQEGKSLPATEADVEVVYESPTLLILTIDAGGFRIGLFSGHCPHAGRRADADTFLEELRQHLVPLNTLHLVLGGIDLNGRPPKHVANTTGDLEFGEPDCTGITAADVFKDAACWLPQTYKRYHVGSSVTYRQAGDILRKVKKAGLGGRKGRTPFRPMPILMTDEGHTAIPREDRDQVWLQHFGKQECGEVLELESFATTRPEPLIVDEELLWSIRQLPAVGEVEQVLRRLPRKKAVGLDAVPGELLCAALGPMAEALQLLMAKSMMALCQPLQWRGGLLFEAWKGQGSHKTPEAYRSLFVASTIGKAYHKVLRQKVQQEVECSLHSFHLGDRKLAPVTLPALYVLSNQRLGREKGCSTSAIFLDTRAAYYRLVRDLAVGPIYSDEAVTRLFRHFSLDQEDLLEMMSVVRDGGMLADGGIEGPLRHAAKDVHHFTWFTTPHTTGQRVCRTAAGSRPGEAWAATIFAFIYGRVLAKISEIARGEGLLPIHPADLQCGVFAEQDEGQTAIGQDATWADDSSWILWDWDPLQLLTKTARLSSLILSHCMSHGMKPNLGRNKTAVLIKLRGPGKAKAAKAVFKTGRSVPHLADLQLDIPTTNLYKHLGGLVDDGATMMAESRRRLSMASQAFDQGKRLVFANSAIPLPTRAMLLQVAVTATYHNMAVWIPGGQAWSHICGGYSRIVRKLLSKALPGDLLFALPPAIAHVVTCCPPFALVARKARLSLLVSLCKAGPIELWAMLQAEQTWFHAVREDLKWLVGEEVKMRPGHCYTGRHGRNGEDC
ncbi:unnamed protein product [Symbiodinium sp. CCMP2456]|nr:unnamed protein product [Symbiodinium sp. CCMP2456]